MLIFPPADAAETVPRNGSSLFSIIQIFKGSFDSLGRSKLFCAFGTLLSVYVSRRNFVNEASETNDFLLDGMKNIASRC